jgi:serine/threonine protein kinase/WD40 repeat protein
MSATADRVQAVFLAALEAGDPASQTAILDRECGTDRELRQRIEALLRAHQDPASVLRLPAVHLLGGVGLESAADQTGPFHVPGQSSARTEVLDEAEQNEAAGVPIDLGFLGPPTRTGSLGRLGHYEVLEVLGRGGFGIVFRAMDETLQRVVAVKVLSPLMAATSPARKRFLREARAYARVRHENVVQVHAVEEAPLPYLVMEFVAGGTLQQLLDRTGPLGVPEVLSIGRQIAEGLAAAHDQGLVHRDVKPANVLLEGGDRHRVKLTDFGLARAADDASISQSGLVAGTPLYMAPEQATGAELDHRADLFSLGSVLYVMCTGRPPFRAANSLAILRRVCEDTPRPIRELIPETPAWLCELIGRLHAKTPSDRLQCAREVADLLTQHAVESAANGKFLLTRQRSSRWPVIAVATALLVALIAIPIWIVLHNSGQHHDRPSDSARVSKGVLVPSSLARITSGVAAQLPFPGRTSWLAQDRQGKWLAVPCENDVVLFDTRTLTPLQVLHAGAERVYCVDFSPDGWHLAVGSWSDDDGIVIWDLETGTRARTIAHHGNCWFVQYSPTGDRLFTVYDDHIPRVWNVEAGKQLREFPVQDEPVCGEVAFSADGKQIFTHTAEGAVTVWDANTGEKKKTLDGPERITVRSPDWFHFPIVSSADGRWLAAGSPTGFKVWEVGTWKEQVPLVSMPASWLAFTPDGSTLVTGQHEIPDQGGPSVAVWDVMTGQRRKSINLAKRGAWSVFHLSTDGKTLYAMACDPAEPSIHVYDAETLEERLLADVNPKDGR